MRRLLLLSIISFFYIAAFSQIPANDNCASAFNMLVSPSVACQNGNSGSIQNATESMPPCIGTAAKDVWYKFTATTSTQIIRLETINSPISIVSPVIEVFSGTCGSLTSIACNNTAPVNFVMTQTLTNLTAGTIYYLRIYSNDPLSAGYYFGLCIYQVPDNDECSGAVQVTVSPTAGCANSINTSSVGASSSLPPCSGTQSNDVWYKFTAIDTLTVVQLTSTGITNPVIEVFSGSCGSLSSLFCISKAVHNSKVRELIKGLAIGDTYYLRIYSGNSAGASFALCIYQPQANDDCGGAINIPQNSGLSWTNYITASNKNMSPSLGSCALVNNNDGDSWYKFIAQDSVQLIHVEVVAPTGGFNTSVQIYSGDCGNLSVIPSYRYDGLPMNCFSPVSSDGYNKIGGLVTGQTYYVRVMNEYPASIVNNDSIRIRISNPQPNDGITGAIDLTVNTGTTVVTKTQGNIHNASPSYPGVAVPNCGPFYNSFYPDVWYKFIATSDRHLISLHNLSSTALDPSFEVYTYNSGVLTSIACAVGNAGWRYLDLSSLIPTTVYYIRAGNREGVSNYLNDRLFELSITTPGSIVVNDDCANAQVIPFDQQILASNMNSTFTPTIFSGCNFTGTAPRDVWYSFTPTYDATAQLQFVLPFVSPYENNTNLGIELYTGNCGSMTRINCVNTTQSISNLNFTALLGQTYLVRIFSFNASFQNTPFTVYFSSFFNLPVKLTSFEARVMGNKSVKIIWKTDEESGIDYYEIERSTDGANFKGIGKVISRNSTTPADYFGEDLSPATGNNYYRLKIVNQDGKIEYSRIVNVKFKGSFTDNLQLTRQGNNLLINNQSAVSKSTTIGVYTATGQKLFSQQKVLSAGANKLNLQGRIQQVLFIKIEVAGEETKTFKLAY